MSQKQPFEKVEKLTDRLFTTAAEKETENTSMPARTIAQLGRYFGLNR